ncbi:MscS Mechanosensitive ion channel [Halorhabdus utahensis DSM 12940]|uniref:MscS Mechanosensitive ion channel n=1 Tax=Halorhabdus utahensis (strain DSM 12940 / JCM 11049 / AX-2) TaxID=519442 RepID=C7NR08_HALUD|nr:mechanosensitive ion channel family protein [Halorhabdus utahensis]ACV12921.1 MscS Mechanosensitive ion channel [Halorhabdus utahensis DSM 12940]
MQPVAVGWIDVLGATTTEAANPVQALEWVPAWIPDWTLDVVSVVIVLGLAWAASRFLIGLLGRRIARRFRRPSLTRAFIRGIRAGVFGLALLVILRIFGLELGDIALSVTVFSAVIGVILAPIVGSVISGIFLLADQPYEIGDMVELADTGQRGFVEDITLRYTKIFTLDNTFLVIPNGTIRERDVINYSAEDSRVRESIDVVVTYEGDLETARDRFIQAARSVDGVIGGGPDIRVGAARYPASPVCHIGEFGDHGIRLTLRYWIEVPYRMQAIRSQIQTAIWEAIDDLDVEIAYPHSHLVFDDTSGQLRVSHDEGVSESPGRQSPSRDAVVDDEQYEHRDRAE